LIVERPDEWNDFALERQRSDKALAVVPRAPRGLEEVAEQALHWFSRYLVSESVASAGAASS
jgi:hypothetical protein